MSEQQLLEDVKFLCPYTSVCGENASLPFPGSNKEVPCCQDCSCDPSCGLHSSCCYKSLDTFNIEETYQMICRSTLAKANSLAKSQYFRMINKCIPSYTDQGEVDKNYSPVYSYMTGFIYFNAAIASCNNVNITVPFKRAIRCPFQTDFMRDVHRILTGLKPYTDCQEKYLPPDGIDLKSEECTPTVIRKCNVTGTVMVWKPFWPYCESFNATFILQSGHLEYVYANIYCYMCNEQYNKNRLGKLSYKCSRWVDKVWVGDHSLTIILAPGLTSTDENVKHRTGTSRTCPPNEVIVNSFTVSN